jgi:hypothetical protein
MLSFAQGVIFSGPTNYFVGVDAVPPVGISLSIPESIAIGDFNGDGKQDLAVACFYGTGVSILLGNGNGSFGSVFSTTRVGTYPYAVAVGDFNADGKQDRCKSTMIARSRRRNVFERLLRFAWIRPYSCIK